jgi:hypothetical protein
MSSTRAGLAYPRFFRRLDPNKNFLPLMVLARNFSIPSERLLQYLYILHLANIEPTPSGKAAATSSANLPRKQPLNPFLNAVIMRFDNPFFALIFKTNQPLLFDRSIKHRIRFLINCHEPTYLRRLSS